MKLNGLAKVVNEKMVQRQLTFILKNDKNDKVLFKHIKRIHRENLVAYYVASRTYGHPSLCAAIRDNIFVRYANGEG